MELAGSTLRRSLPSASPAAAMGRRRRSRAPARVACVGGGTFAEEGHIGYYETAAPRRKTVEAVARDLARIRAMGLVAGDAAKEKVLSEATDLLLQELNVMKDEEYKMKKTQKEEKAAMKALKKEQEAKKAAAATMMTCEDESSESSESDCEDEQGMNIEQGMVISAAIPEVVASDISTVSVMECEKAAMKAMKKMEKEQMKAMKKMEKEQKKAAKKAMKKMEKEAKKMAMATLNGCMGEDDSSCSSESSDSECEGEVVKMSRCATITAPEAASPSMVFPIIVPQIPASLPLEPSQTREPATAVQVSSTSSVAVVEISTATANRIEVCMGGKCKKAGALALLQEFEKTVGTGGVVVGCKCLGKCGLGPNVRLRSEVSAEGSAKRNPLCIGVGLEDVGTIVAGLGDLGMTPAA